MRFYFSIGTYPAIRCYHAKPFAISGPFAIRGLPFFPRDRSAVRVTELVPRGRAFGEARFPEMIRTNVWQG